MGEDKDGGGRFDVSCAPLAALALGSRVDVESWASGEESDASNVLTETCL